MKDNFMLRSSVIIALVFLFLYSHVSSGQEAAVDPAAPKEKQSTGEKILDQTKQYYNDATEAYLNALNENKKLRESFDFFALLSYSQIDFIIPGKIGASLGYNSSTDNTWELEYLHGSFSVPFIIKDLGKMSDDRFSLIRRSYFGSETFNLSYGISYFDFSLHLGDKFLNQLTGGAYPSLELINIKSLGFNIGIGNRWSFKNRFMFSIDWISWSQPLAMIKREIPYLDYATNESDKEDVDNASKLIAYFPRVTLLKLQIGYLF